MGGGQEIQKRSMTKAHPLWSIKVMFEPETRPLTTLCTYSFRQESATAAAKWLAVLVKNIQHGDPF